MFTSKQIFGRIHGSDFRSSFSMDFSMSTKANLHCCSQLCCQVVRVVSSSVSNSFKSETATFGVKNRPNFLFPKTAIFLAQTATILNYSN